MLATDSTLRGQYIAWLSIATFVYFFFLVKTWMDYKDAVAGDPNPQADDNNIVHCCGSMSYKLRHSISAATTGFYVAFIINSLFGFFLILLFPVTTMQTAHNIYAGFLFVGLFFMQL